MIMNGSERIPENWCGTEVNSNAPDHVSFDASELSEVTPDGPPGKYFSASVFTGGYDFKEETNCTIRVTDVNGDNIIGMGSR